MEKYWRWIEQGYMSSTGEMFDIGGTTSDALCRFKKDGNPMAGDTDPKTSGNGSLMRLVPIPLFYTKETDCINYAGLSSATTHKSNDCIWSCVYFSRMVHRALNGQSKGNILFDENHAQWNIANELLEIVQGKYKHKTEDQIKSSGFVIHTLEAALWSFYTTETFEEGVIKAVNLGDDADTVGAVYGQIAGAYYGFDKIPKKWVEQIALKDIILSIADGLFFTRLT
jgi:ADP-ribosyl-[dinitrogen reductase] hydrolase